MDHILVGRILRHLLFHIDRWLPFPLIGNQAQESVRHGVVRVAQNRQRQLFDPLAGQAMSLAPEGHLNVGFRLVSQLAPGCLVDCEIGRRGGAGL